MVCFFVCTVLEFVKQMTEIRYVSMEIFSLYQNLASTHIVPASYFCNKRVIICGRQERKRWVRAHQEFVRASRDVVCGNRD